jgi:hypothetical protein
VVVTAKIRHAAVIKKTRRRAAICTRPELPLTRNGKFGLISNSKEREDRGDTHSRKKTKNNTADSTLVYMMRHPPPPRGRLSH